MDSRKLHIFYILMLIAAICESGVIGPHDVPEGILAGGGKPQNDKRLGWQPGKWDPTYFQPKEIDSDVNPDVMPPESEDDEDPNEIDEDKPETIPEKHPSEHDELPEEDVEENDKIPAKEEPAGDVLPKPFDEEDEFDESLEDGKGPKIPDSESPVDDDNHPEPPVHEDEDESAHEEGDESHNEEDGEPNEDDDDVEDHVLVDEVDKDLGEEESVPSFLDTPFFNLDQVRKYFHQLESALDHVFRQTVEEAKLLNGTYANTTEEEVDIGGKKYTVHKSVIKDGDNDSSIYVETLSAKPQKKKIEGAKTKIDRR